MTTIELLQRLCQLLASDRPTVADVAATLGGAVVARDSTVATVRPAQPAIQEARIVTEPGVEEPSYVELLPAPGERPTLALLKASFGDYRTLPRVHWNAPRRVIFYPEPPGASHRCAIIAELSAGATDLEAAAVATLTIRRDVRLD